MTKGTLGTFIHQYQIEQARLLAMEYEIQALKEFGVTLPDGKKGRIDLFLKTEEWSLAWESELTFRRACLDISKAEAANATGLIIAVPNYRIAAACNRALARSNIVVPDWVSVLVLGQALKLLRNYLQAATPGGGTT